LLYLLSGSFLFLSSLELITSVVSVSPLLSEFLINLSVRNFLSDLLSLFSLGSLGNSNNVSFSVLVLSQSLDGFSGGVVDQALLGNTFLLGEEDQSFLIGEESLDVSLERVDRLVLSSVVNRDTDRSSEGNTELGSLDFFKGETSTSSLSLVMLLSAASDNGSQSINRSGEDLSSSFSSVSQSSGLSGGLVEPGLDSSLPMLSKMGVREDVVMLDHCRLIEGLSFILI